MIAIIFKEIREHFKWAVLWMLGVMLAMAFVLVPESIGWSGSRIQTLCSENLQLLMSFGSAIGAALLGMLQSITEVRRDQCAFLFHRPLTRTRIFASKVVGGLTLYLTAMSIPLLLATLWARTPGQFAAPFDLRMSLAGVADILTGIVFYFGGILAGMRSARWYGSRALGVVAAIPCSMAVWAVPEFWHALIVIGVFIATLGFAAWGSFTSLGAYEPQSRSARFALGLSVLVGLTVIGGAVAGITNVVNTPRDGQWVAHAVDEDGTVICIAYDRYSVLSITDLNGGAIEKYATPKSRENYRRTTLSFGFIRLGSRNRWSGYRSDTRFYSQHGALEDTVWYYVNAARRVQGYSVKTNRRVASFGPDGFTSTPVAASASFAEPRVRTSYSDCRLLVSPSTAYRVNYRSRTIKPILTGIEDSVITGACMVPRKGGAKTADGIGAAVSTSERIELFAEDGSPIFRTPLHCDPAKYGVIEFATTAEEDRHFVWYNPAPDLPRGERMTLPGVIVELSADGTEVRRHELPSQLKPAGDIPWHVSLIAIIEPPYLVAFAGVYFFLTSGLDLSAGDVSANILLLRILIPNSFAVLCGVVILVTSVCCALAAGVIGGRYGFARDLRRRWAIICFFTGLGGLLTMWALIDWPAREACASCRKKTAVDRDRCQHCDAEFPSPTLDGTEVFD